MRIKDDISALVAAARDLHAIDDPQRLLDLVERGSPYDIAFFREIEDPAWLPILTARGYYETLPPVSDLNAKHSSYPPLMALANLAERQPMTVAEILKGLPLPSNPVVGDQCMRIIAGIKGKAALSIVHPVALKLAKSAEASSQIWILDILKNYLASEQVDECLAIAREHLFSALKSRSNSSNPQVEWHDFEIDQEILAPIAHEYSLEVAQLAINGLTIWGQMQTAEFQSLGAKVFDNPDYFYPSKSWIANVKAPASASDHTESLLVKRLYLCGAHIFRTASESSIVRFDSALRSQLWDLFSRVRWQLYADFPDASQQLARRDVVSRVQLMGKKECLHGFEFAQMLESHAKIHGHAFLAPEEVNQFTIEVLSGPVDTETGDIDFELRDAFQRKQLFPIRGLLTGSAEAVYERLSAGKSALTLSRFKAPEVESTGFKVVEHVPPARVSQFNEMSLEELIEFVQSWKPDEKSHDPAQFWKREDLEALATSFADFFHSNRQRFPSNARWWKRITRPVLLSKVLDRAVDQLARKASLEEQKISIHDWENWFGICTWISEQLLFGARARHDDTKDDWSWARMVAVRFLGAAVRLAPKKFESEIGRLLRKFVEDPDSYLDFDVERGSSDWLTIGINSVRGTAIEQLISLAWDQKKVVPKNKAKNWIFDVVESRLSIREESPAVFAICGSRLRMVLQLFSHELPRLVKLLLPSDRQEHLMALAESYVMYDNPSSHVLRGLPNILDACFVAMERFRETKGEDSRAEAEFSSRLGAHIGFYFWNDAFTSEEIARGTVDKFFRVASDQARAMTIGQIGDVFSDSVAEARYSKLYKRVMMLWERRFEQILLAIAGDEESFEHFEGELVQFLDWLGCDCFPITWRYEQIILVLKTLRDAPRSFALLKSLRKIAEAGAGLPEAVSILWHVVRKLSPNAPWYHSERDLKCLLRLGVNAASERTRREAMEIQDGLLTLGYLAYLSLD